MQIFCWFLKKIIFLFQNIRQAEDEQRGGSGAVIRLTGIRIQPFFITDLDLGLVSDNEPDPDDRITCSFVVEQIEMVKKQLMIK